MMSKGLTGKLGQWWCGLWSLGRHHNLGVMEKDNWHLVCTHCGRRSAGWLIDSNHRPVALTSRQVEQQQQDLYDDIFDAEMEVHGGG